MQQEGIQMGWGWDNRCDWEHQGVAGEVVIHWVSGKVDGHGDGGRREGIADHGNCLNKILQTVRC